MIVCCIYDLSTSLALVYIMHQRYGNPVLEIMLLDNGEPSNYAEAMVSPDSEAWLEAMRSELKSMDENQVWDLVDPPPGVTAIGCKWVFKKKPMWMEMSRSTKLGLSLKVMDKFKELTTTRLTRR